MNDLDANAYSTIFSFLSLLASTVTSIIAISISVKTLKQNNKMIEESTRPVVGIYSKYTDGILYIVMKNFGNSPCVIDNIETDMNISEEESQTIHGNPYLKAKGATLPPNGKMICPLIPFKLKTRKFNFYIQYHSSSHKYEERIFLDCDADNPFPDTHSSVRGADKSLEKISRSLQDIYKTKI